MLQFIILRYPISEYLEITLLIIFLISGILVCTDVMARGVDIPEIHWVIQYDPPSSAPLVVSGIFFSGLFP